MSVNDQTGADPRGSSFEEELYDELEDEGTDRYLTFRLHDESYGINIAAVTEIIGLQKITPIPEVPAFIRGVINLRGKIIPIMDVRLRFNLPERPYNDRTCIIVVGVQDVAVGLAIDEVQEVVRIDPAQIDPAPTFVDNSQHQFINGLGKQGDDVKVLLDVERLIRKDDLQTLEKVQQAR